MKNLLLHSVAVFLFFNWPWAIKINAEEPEILKYYIVVTATRTEQPALELASSVTIIAKEDWQKSGKRTVAEVLTAVPGLSVFQSGGVGKNIDVFIRGANSAQTLIMLDGIELNDPVSPGRAYDLAHLTLDGVERIEIVRGPQSTLYGSDAIGGVINIITKKGAGKPGLFLCVETGSFGSFHESAAISGGSEKIDYALNLSRFDSKGFSASAEKYGNREKDGYGNTSLNAKLAIKPGENIAINFMSRYIATRNELDNGSGPGGDDPNYLMYGRQFLFAVATDFSLLNGKWKQQLKFSSNNSRQNTNNDFDAAHTEDSSIGLYRGRMFRFDWQNNVFLNNGNTITAGLEMKKEIAESKYSWNSAWGPGISDFPEKSARLTGIYLQDNMHFGDLFFITLGIRLDHHDRFGTESTLRMAPAMVFKSGTKIKATFGTGFKAPSLFQLYAPATEWGPVGNENLKAEKSMGLDLGIEQFLFQDRLLLALTYFRNDFKRLIDYDWSMGYINVVQAQSQGIEFNISAQLLPNLTLKGSYTYTDAFDKESGQKLVRRPQHKADMSVNCTFTKKTNVQVNVVYLGKRDDFFPYPTRTTAVPFTLFNMVAAYQLNKNFNIFVRVNNLFDLDYEEVLGYGTAGRSAYLGFRVNL